MIAQRPNLLIFCTDEQRGDHPGCMGHPHLHAPHIDRLADQTTLPGKALTPVVTSDARPQRKNALIEYDHETHAAFDNLQCRSLVTNNWKLVFYIPTDDTMRFDRNNDPDKLVNLAGNPEYQNNILEMFQKLTHELSRTEARLPRSMGS